MTSGGGAGGAANEQGSLHRNGVAAYLAVHGLVGIPVAGLADAVPRRIHLEAATAVDDIVCAMQNQAIWYVQAKRRAGRDAALRGAIVQWIAQPLEPADRLVLASREFRGPLRNLQPVIDGVVADRGAPIAKGAQGNLNDLIGLLEDAGAADGQAMLLHLILLQCAVESPADPHEANAIAMLAGTIVSPTDAPAAFEALRNQMQHIAAQREWSEVDDWIGAIAAAGIEVYADADGAPGARAAADLRAIAVYREAVAARLDLLDLSTLDPGLGFVRVDNLLDDWEVEWESETAHPRDRLSAGLWSMVRRNPRFVLTGHPGVGKSEALRQISAAMAADPGAPVPIHVDLREVLAAIQRSEDVTLDLVLTQASRIAPVVAPEVMVRALRQAVLAGSAVLIVDGLDEARRRRGSVAVGLNQLVSQLPETTGFILSTRPSALDAVRALDMHAVRLQPPAHLAASLEAVLRVMAEQVDQAERAIWLAARLAVLKRHSQDSEIWKIPLLASLATIRIGRDRTPASTAAGLLNDVVLDSVKSWEELKATHGDGLDDEMRAEMLMDGFVTIGRLLNESVDVSTDQARNALSWRLQSWGHSERLTELLAEQVVHFWDERVGIFVEHDGKLIARSRQFAEVADVAWIAPQPEEAKREWLRVAARDADRMHTVKLAASQDASIREGLIDLARRDIAPDLRDRAVAWLAEVWTGWDPDNATIEQAIHVLADAAEDTLPVPDLGEGIIERLERAQRHRDGDGWHCVISLARAELTELQNTIRQERLASLELSDARRNLVELLIGLSSARREKRLLTEQEREGIERILAGTRPAAAVMVTRPDGAHSLDISEHFITGVAEVIDLALDHIDELPADAPAAFFDLTREMPMSVYERVETVLRARGIPDPKPFWTLKPAFEEMMEGFKDFHGLGWMLRQVAAMYPDVVGPPVEMWRRTQLADFLFALGWGQAPVSEMRLAAKEDATILTTWFSAVITAYGLDGSLVATQARQTLACADKSRDALHVMTTRPLDPSDVVRQVDCPTASEVARAFSSSSPWIAGQAFDLVLNATCPAVADVIAGIDGAWMWRPHFLATIAALANTADTEGWIARTASADSAERAGLAVILPQLKGQHDGVAEALAQDNDATVRHYAGGSIDGATTWTCTWCYRLRPISEVPCATCHQSPPWARSS
jgi:hypothetical protein